MDTAKIVACLTIAFGATSADAQDVFSLAKFGHWDVSYVDGPAGPYCSASVVGDGLYLSIDVGRNTGVRVYIIDDQKNWIAQRGLTIFAQVDARASWQIGSVASYDSVMEFSVHGDAGIRFLEELSDGRQVQFDYNEDGTAPGYGDVTFSLVGSGAAINALGECAGRL